MEIVLALLVAGFAGYWFFFRNKEELPVSKPTSDAPYKVETPIKEEAPVAVAEVKKEEPAPVVVAETVAITEPAPAPVLTEAAPVEPAKKTRKPRATKAEKPAAKKAATKKAAAMKATKKSKNS
jgi:hypothetical protein